MGVQLVDLFAHRVSLRKIVLCARELGEDSLVAKELSRRANHDEPVWSEGMQLLAHAVNLLAGIQYYLGVQIWAKQQNPKDSDKPEVPVPIRPPGWRPEPVRMSTDEELFRFFGGGAKGGFIRAG